MAIAGTSTYNLTAQEIIDLALTDVGALGPGAPSDADLRPHALKLLNLLLKSLDARGQLLWSLARRTQTLAAGTAAYALSSDVLDVDEPMRYVALSATTGTPVYSMSRDEYMTLPDRTTRGIPSRYLSEKALNASGVEVVTLSLYPVPPTTGDTLEYAASVRMPDVTTLAQTLAVPQKWLSAIRLGLAASMAAPFGVPIDRAEQLNSRAEAELMRVVGDDNERGSTMFVPFGGTNYGGAGW